MDVNPLQIVGGDEWRILEAALDDAQKRLDEIVSETSPIDRALEALVAAEQARQDQQAQDSPLFASSRPASPADLRDPGQRDPVSDYLSALAAPPLTEFPAGYRPIWYNP